MMVLEWRNKLWSIRQTLSRWEPWTRSGRHRVWVCWGSIPSRIIFKLCWFICVALEAGEEKRREEMRRESERARATQVCQRWLEEFVFPVFVNECVSRLFVLDDKRGGRTFLAGYRTSGWPLFARLTAVGGSGPRTPACPDSPLMGPLQINQPPTFNCYASC